MPGLDRAVTLSEAQEFFAQHPDGIMIKALAGGGGRGTRAVTDSEQLEALFHRCQSEAEAAFGIADVYVEAFMAKARHVEVQIIGDEHGAVSNLGERECSAQRRNQKLVEIVPRTGSGLCGCERCGWQ